MFFAAFDSAEAFVMSGRKAAERELPPAPNAGGMLDRNDHEVIVGVGCDAGKDLGGMVRVAVTGPRGRGTSGCAPGAGG